MNPLLTIKISFQQSDMHPKNQLKSGHLEDQENHGHPTTGSTNHKLLVRLFMIHTPFITNKNCFYY